MSQTKNPIVITPQIKIPNSWKQAAGLLKNKKIDALKYQRQIRQEWNGRSKKLSKNK